MFYQLSYEATQLLLFVYVKDPFVYNPHFKYTFISFTCSPCAMHQLSYEATQLGEVQFVGLTFVYAKDSTSRCSNTQQSPFRLVAVSA